MGRVLCFPPRRGAAGLDDGDVATSIRVSIVALLGSRTGEDPLLPTLGLDLHDVSLLLDMRLRAELRHRILRGIARHEPRARNVQVHLEDDASDGLAVFRVVVTWMGPDGDSDRIEVVPEV